MNSVRFYLIKNKELVLYLICFFSHAIFAPFFKLHGFIPLFIYNTAIAFVYGIFILLYSAHFRHFFIDFSFIEILCYSLFMTITTGTDFGTRMFSICLIPAFFFFVYDSSSSVKYHVIMSVIAAAVTIFIIWWQFARPRAIYSGFITAVSRYKVFYRIHVIFSTIVTITFIFYQTVITEYAISRNTKKTKKHAAELNYMANHDQLTGLLNRRKITSHCSALEYKKNQTGQDYAISIFDIDNFKSVNDTFGHDAGDYILIEISSLVQKLLPENAIMARWGGEEFLIAFEDCSKKVPEVLEKIRREVQGRTYSWQGRTIPITLTLGAANSKTNLSMEKIIVKADNNLYYGKTHGKNQVCCFGADFEESDA